MLSNLVMYDEVRKLNLTMKPIYGLKEIRELTRNFQIVADSVTHTHSCISFFSDLAWVFNRSQTPIKNFCTLFGY